MRGIDEAKQETITFRVAARVQIVMTGAAISEAMDQPRITVESKDDRLVGREKRIELAIRKSVWMFLR